MGGTHSSTPRLLSCRTRVVPGRSKLSTSPFSMTSQIHGNSFKDVERSRNVNQQELYLLMIKKKLCSA